MRIVQYGIQSTGSTLVFNALKIMYPDCEVAKTHWYYKKFKGEPTVFTYRDLKQQAASQQRKLNDNFNKEFYFNWDCLNKRKENIHNHLEQLRLFQQNCPIIYLQYERFYKDFDYMFDKIEDFLGEVDQEKKDRIRKEWNLEAVKEKQSKLGDFSDIDDQTQLHGNHVHKDGKPYWQEIVPDDMKMEFIKTFDNLNKRLKKLINEDTSLRS